MEGVAKTTPPRFSTLGEDRVWKPKPLRRVEILCMGMSCLEFVQECYHKGPREKDHEVWTINSGPAAFQFDQCWNMHDLYELLKHEPQNDYFGLYKNLGKPLISVKAYEEIPSSLEFPLAEAIKEFQSNYTATTVCYMIMGALMCGVQEIGIWGADYVYPEKSSYEKGRGNVEFWLGYCHAKGVKLTIAQSSTLMDQMYRFEGNNGAVGYGKVYGYFDQQPEFALVGDEYQLLGFKKKVIENEPR